MMAIFGKKKPRERTLWKGSNSLLTNAIKRTMKPDFYKITNYRVYKSKSNLFRLGSETESIELFRIQNISVDQGPYQKLVGLGAGDVIIRSPEGTIAFKSVPRCKKVESRIWAAISEAKNTLGLHPE